MELEIQHGITIRGQIADRMIFRAATRTLEGMEALMESWGPLEKP